MLVSTYILFEVIFISLFFLAWFQKHELLWGMSLVVGAMQMVSAYGIETIGYIWDPTLGAYAMGSFVQSYPYLMGINFMFFALGVLFGISDIVDKYKEGSVSDPEVPG